jgi:hypothetical protein
MSRRLCPVTKALHLLVVVSMLFNLAPVVGRAAPAAQGAAGPPVITLASLSGAQHRSFQLAGQADLRRPVVAREDPIEPEPLESPELVIVDQHQIHTVYLPLVARDSAFAPEPVTAVELDKRVEPWLALPGDLVRTP